MESMLRRFAAIDEENHQTTPKSPELMQLYGQECKVLVQLGQSRNDIMTEIK